MLVIVGPVPNIKPTFDQHPFVSGVYGIGALYVMCSINPVDFDKSVFCGMDNVL